MSSDRIVFVLGAGFTRAFVPGAPLLYDDYDIPNLLKRFEHFPHASQVLQNASAGNSQGRIDLERLMTRLSGMPYDGVDARRELALLESELRKALVKRITDAKVSVASEKLAAFARFVLNNGAAIVTFNYDDVLDQALWEVYRATSDLDRGIPYWHPDGGYGFFCRPSTVCVSDQPIFMDRPVSPLLKLHGSINWRSRLGEGLRLGPAALLHHEGWCDRNRSRHRYEDSEIEAHLEPDPFIVPPVLVKAELSVHPVLRVVWEVAYRRLAEAARVIFIGYSLPETDLASRILFRESVANRGADIRVVSLASSGDEEERIKGAYRSLFGTLADSQFNFSGAEPCIEREFSQVELDASPS